jgi:alkylation response protein AidB-like acyl-CoA dehydrogenase
VARLDGRWPFASNCLHSTWIGLGALLVGPDGPAPPPRVAFVPVVDVTIEDTWDSVGLRGTGSHHVVARDLAVRADHCCTFVDRPWPEGTLWRLPIYTVLLPALASAPLGIARGALDEVARQLREGREARRGQLADDAVGLSELAVAECRLRAARSLLWELVERCHDVAQRGDEVGRPLQAEVYLAALHACDAAVEATSVAHQLGGGGAAYAGSPLLRALCDVEAARQHQLFAHKHRSEFVKVLAGMGTSYPPFLR